MKKIVAMFAITMMLVLSVFGQQATTVAPTPAKKATVKTAKPAIAATAQEETAPAVGVATVAPVQSKAATVQATSATPAQATSVTDSEAAPVASTPTAQVTPIPKVRKPTTAQAPVASTQPASVTSTPTPQTAPAIAAQPSFITSAPEPRVVATRPAATPSGQQAGVTATAPAAKEPDYISEKGFKGKVFEIKYREPSAIRQAISSLGSGFKGAQVSYSDEFKTITVRDFPENIATIEEAIKRLDTPQPRRPDIEFRVQVLIGSHTTIQGDGAGYPTELKGILDQLLATLKYTNYALMFSTTHRTKEGGSGVSNNGVVESKLFNLSIPAGNQIFYDYGIFQINLDSSTSAGTTVQIGNFNFGLRIPLVLGSSSDPKIQYQNVGFRSPVSLREGEKVVVGTTTMGDKGLIVVLTAKVNK